MDNVDRNVETKLSVECVAEPDAEKTLPAPKNHGAGCAQLRSAYLNSREWRLQLWLWNSIVALAAVVILLASVFGTKVAEGVPVASMSMLLGSLALGFMALKIRLNLSDIEYAVTAGNVEVLPVSVHIHGYLQSRYGPVPDLRATINGKDYKLSSCNQWRTELQLNRLADLMISTEVFSLDSKSDPLAFLFEGQLVVLQSGIERRLWGLRR